MKNYIKRPLVPLVLQPWTYPALFSSYGIPRGALKGGTTIGIVELGGALNNIDLLTFCQSQDVLLPAISNVGPTFPSDPNGADVEVALDVEVIASLYYWATGQVASIRIYWGNDIATLVRQAASDGCATCSISWGAPENEWGHAGAMDMEAAAAFAVRRGMAVFAASGDNDAGDGEPGDNIDLPAGAPDIVACSGTTKTSTDEVVWNNGNGEGTGGGYDNIWTMPVWQVRGGAPRLRHGRMVGDVAANADPNTGYPVYVGGGWTTVGGTSAVAPFYAALFAAFGERYGLLGERLWSKASHGFDRVTQGNNSPWPGIVCCGLGRPNSKLYGLF